MGMAAALRAGVVWDNTFNRFDPAASFGGYKESGFGREGGPAGMAAYLAADDFEARGATPLDPRAARNDTRERAQR
jgi:acyl-CoA reductase-like NAD-dependent aldehyde dehydrogenase